MYTRFIYDKNGVHSGLEKHRFHQAEDPCSPDLRKSYQTFVFVCVSIKEMSWLRFIKRTGSKDYFSCKGYFFQIVILNARMWFAFSPPSLCTRLRQGIDI